MAPKLSPYHAPAYGGAHAIRVEDAERAADGGTCEHEPRGVTLQKSPPRKQATGGGGETTP